MHTARLGRGERKRAELNRRPGAKFRLAKRDKKADGSIQQNFSHRDFLLKDFEKSKMVACLGFKAAKRVFQVFT